MPLDVPTGTFVVVGLEQIQRDLAKSIPAASKALTFGLHESARPVSQLAQSLSLSRIGENHGHKMQRSPQWAVTRIGVTRKAVYIVPRERGVRPGEDPRRSRPNLVGLMMGKSFEPALELGGDLVERNVTRVLEGVLP